MLNKYAEKAKENSTGFQDVIETANTSYAYTRGSTTKILVRSYTDKKYEKTLKIPDPLVVFCYHPDGRQIVAITCPDKDKPTVPYKKVKLLFFDVATGNITKTIKGLESHTVVLAYHACACVSPTRGVELVWATLMQVNFWNLETGEERIAFKSVSRNFFILFCM